MNLFFRILGVFIRALFRTRLDFLEESVLKFRVLPNDLDLNLHMTNSRYLSIMDLGRIDHMVRTGAFAHVFKGGWRPILGSVHVRFRLALKVFQRYHLHTRIIGFDEKWVYFEHRILTKGHLVSYAIAKGLFVSKRGTLPTQTVLETLGIQKLHLPLPDSIKLWKEMEEKLREEKP